MTRAQAGIRIAASVTLSERNYGDVCFGHGRNCAANQPGPFNVHECSTPRTLELLQQRVCTGRSLAVAFFALCEALLEAAPQLLAAQQHREARPSRGQLDHLHLLAAIAVRARVGRRLVDRRLDALAAEPPHIRKTPKVVSGIGALSAAEIPSASTRRVSSGSMTPSSHSRVVE